VDGVTTAVLHRRSALQSGRTGDVRQSSTPYVTAQTLYQFVSSYEVLTLTAYSRDVRSFEQKH